MSACYFSNPTSQLRMADPYKELIESLTRINTSNPPVHTCSTGWTLHGFYAGPTSIAYLFYRLSVIYPNLEFKGQTLFEWAEAYLELGSRVHRRTPTPNHCGIANEMLAHTALSAVMRRDASLARQICAYQSAINDADGEGSNEWLYGRAGYLYLLRLCRAGFANDLQSSTVKLIDSTIERTVQTILEIPQPWTWHGKQYLGAAHGTISIITQLILSAPSIVPRVQPLLTDLLETQFKSGNFPSSLPAGSDRLVQFCHGGPGFAISLRSLRPRFPQLETKIRGAITKAQADIWERGLLTKEPCLCHGIASNALALEDDQQFMHFLSFMGTKSMEKIGWMKDEGRSDESASLYTGEAGRAWAWAVADKSLPRTCIGYNDL